MDDRTTDTLKFEIFGQAPVQALGTVAGRELYFRARHDEWEFEVALEDGEIASDHDEPPVFHRTGRSENAGFMSEEEAEALVRNCAEQYLAETGA